MSCLVTGVGGGLARFSRVGSSESDLGLGGEVVEL